jgi:hypothetical protein
MLTWNLNTEESTLNPRKSPPFALGINILRFGLLGVSVGSRIYIIFRRHFRLSAFYYQLQLLHRPTCRM